MRNYLTILSVICIMVTGFGFTRAKAIHCTIEYENVVEADIEEIKQLIINLSEGVPPEPPKLEYINTINGLILTSVDGDSIARVQQ